MPSFTTLYLGYIVPASTLLPIGYGFFHYKQLTPGLRAVLTYLCVAFTVNCIAIIFSHSNNLPLLHIYTIIEFVLLARCYLFIFTGSTARRVLIGMAIAFPVFAVLNFLFIQNIYTYNTYTRPIEAIVFIICSMLYFFRNDTETQRRWINVPNNWINAGILLYFSGAIGQFAFSNIVGAVAPLEIALLIWILHATLVLMMYISFTISFWKCKLL
ncbi:hypothetical protein LX64_03117 [Chitinophaga skermanii]|uniref:YhhN-like protein n=1 Tax=Chitinophaga skermanii TaxID=331697 RepID=A0A327QR12_9BACT|nr:hypothetical protein [Chitinophaga skermanii]RAJ04237.1 hypothetical protein LX64_03117 [Chitinophaga skermanii]